MFDGTIFSYINYKCPINKSLINSFKLNFKVMFRDTGDHDNFEMQSVKLLSNSASGYKNTQILTRPFINPITFRGNATKQSNNLASEEKRKKVRNHFILAIEKGELKEGKLTKAYELGLLTKQDILEIATSQAGKIPKKDLDFLIRNKIPLTPIDNNAILNARLYNLMTKKLDVNSFSYRQQKSEIIKNEIAKMAKVPSERKISIAIGLPASGKSTLLNDLKSGYYLADSDEYKKQFKEYAGGKGASTVHLESRELLVNHMLPEAFSKGKNITLSTIRDVSFIEEIAKKAKELNYSVEIIHIAIDIEKSIQRTYKRFLETGRLVDPYLINSIKNTYSVKIEDMPDYFKNSPLIDIIQVYDNNGLFPQLIRTIKK